MGWKAALTIGNQSGSLQGTAPNRLWHPSIMIKVLTIHMIQFMVDNVNMMMIIAKSHFRDRAWSPLVLFHHEIP